MYNSQFLKAETDYRAEMMRRAMGGRHHRARVPFVGRKDRVNRRTR